MELRAEELRIGNYVNCPREDQNPFRIDLIEYACDGYAKVGMNVHKYETPFGLIDGHPLTWELKDLQPIPLTEEILLKCGFEKLHHFCRAEYILYIDEELNIECFLQQENRDINFVCRLAISNDNYDENIDLGNFVCYRNVDLKYLHQLQNLYFALTSQELNVKL